MNPYKTIYVMPHSHFDYGYTHPQRMLFALQKDYLTEAIRLCLATKDYPKEARFKWTIEANEILITWLQEADEASIADLKRCLAEGSIAITALPFHTTPLADVAELLALFVNMKAIQQSLGYEIKTAINHDINGQAWTLQQLLRQAGVDFYLTGINIHFGGIPFERPAPFLWEGPDKETLACFLGEHYSLFSQFAHTERLPGLLAKGATPEEIYDSMREDLAVYEEELQTRSWAKDFYFLTATNPPLYDNNSPDHFLPEAVRLFNEYSKEQKIVLITIDEWRNLVHSEWAIDQLPRKRGDWTDYWNFGAGSTPAETRIHKAALRQIEQTKRLSTIAPQSPQTLRALEEAADLALLFAEHTWGASEAITDPGKEMTKAQRVHKDHLAWDASALASYALGSALETLNQKPGTFSLADPKVHVSLYNPCPYAVSTKRLPLAWVEDPAESSLEALRIKSILPYDEKPVTYLKSAIDLPAFSRRSFTLAEISDLHDPLQCVETIDFSSGDVSTETRIREVTCFSSRIRVDGMSGRILGLTQGGRAIEGGAFGFASLVREQLGEEEANTRATFFPRDVMLGNLSKSVWNHNWQAVREIPQQLSRMEIWQNTQTFVLRRVWKEELSCQEIIIDLRFEAASDEITVSVLFDTVSPVTPISYYLTFPTDLEEGWTARFDTAGLPVSLEADQLGQVSKDWLTLDSYYQVSDEARTFLLLSPDTPLLQPEGFGFGRESQEVARGAKPLVLAWLANNYWDTNFNASFGGRLHYDFRVKLAERLTAKECDELAKGGEDALLATWSLGVLDETWYDFSSDSAVLQILDQTEEGLRLGVRNLSVEDETSYTFRWLAGLYDEAYRLTPQGLLGERLPIGETGLVQTLEAGGFDLILLKGGVKDES